MRVVVVEGQRHIRSALRFLIEGQPGVQLVAAFGARADLMVRLLALRPDVVLLDWELPEQLAERALLALRLGPSPPRVIVLSARPEDEPRAHAAGADAFISKSQPPRLLIPSLYPRC